MQFGGRENRIQAQADPMSRRIGRIRAGIERVLEQLINHLQLDLHDHLTVAFAGLQSLTNNHRDRLARSVAVAIIQSIYELGALVKTVDVLLGPTTIGC